MLILLLAILCLPSQAAKYGSGIKLKDVQAKAISVAMQAFVKEESNVDINHYSVYIRQWREYPTSAPSSNFEVIFVPDLDPEKLASGMYISPEGRNIGNIYGREIHYIISANTFEVLKKLFAK